MVERSGGHGPSSSPSALPVSKIVSTKNIDETISGTRQTNEMAARKAAAFRHHNVEESKGGGPELHRTPLTACYITVGQGNKRPSFTLMLIRLIFKKEGLFVCEGGVA